MRVFGMGVSLPWNAQASNIQPPVLQRESLAFLRRNFLTMSSSMTLLGLFQPNRVLGAQLILDDDVDEARTVHLFEEATRSVVSVQDLEFVKPSGANIQEFDEDSAEVQGVGSGFIWDRFGHIVTNYHVVSKVAKDTTDRQRIKVSLIGLDGNSRSYNARIIGLDPSRDLAVLKVDVEEVGEVSPATIGSSKDLRVGQSCYAIGNPYGYEHTLTTGVVSGVSRQIPSPIGKPIFGAIQTDASINAGNSGGPLLDSFGRVIGVNTATFTRRGSGMSSGVNFAIAIDLVRQVVPHLIVEGTVSSSRSVERAVLGPPVYPSIP